MPTQVQLGRYRMIEKIGSGGMGEVYLAEDSRLSRQIALKTLPPDVASDSERMRRFMHEARTASALNHPNIITIFEISDDGSTPYIAMEYVKGHTLAKLQKNKRLPLADVLDIASQVAAALAAAHEANIVHRDIKPDNIILRPDGIVKVLDFGLAKLTENDGLSDPDAETVALRTNPGMILGTASFMSPEQARGKDIDGRSDIFSFGIVLYQMLSGRLPFRGENYVDVIGAIIHTEPPPFAELDIDVPVGLESLVRKCLRKNREERFQTARELYADISELRRTLDLEFSGRRETFSSDANTKFHTESGERGLTTAGATRIATSSISRMIADEVTLHPLRALIIMLVLIAGIGAAGVGYTKFALMSAPSFESMRFAKVTTSGNLEAMVTAMSPEGRLVAYVTSTADGESLWVKQADADSALQLVPPSEGDFSGLAFSPNSGTLFYTKEEGPGGRSSLFQIGSLGGPPRRLAVDAEGPLTVAPDGGHIAFVRDKTDILIAGVDGGPPRHLKKSDDGARWIALSWSPDGAKIAASFYSAQDSRHHLVLIDTEKGQTAPFGGPWLRTSGIAWVGDESGLYLAARDLETQLAQIWFISYPTGEVRRVTNDLNTYVTVGASDDGSSIVTVQESRIANVWTISDQPGAIPERATFGQASTDGASGVALSPDGRIVYTTRNSGNEDIWITSPNGGTSVQLTSGANSNFAPNVSPDGGAIVFISTRSGGPGVWKMDINGENPVELANSPGVEMRPRFTPDGNYVVYHLLGVNNRISVWRVPAGGGTPEQVSGEGEEGRGEISPDGRSIAIMQGWEPPGSSTLVVRPIEGGTEQVVRLPDGVSSREFRWSTDGKGIVFVRRTDGTEDLWCYELAAGELRRVTNVAAERIFNFDVSPALGKYALSRGEETADVVLISRSK